MDAFAEFDLPRSPFVDETALVRKFDELSRSQHPDAGGHSAAFARLVEGRRTLTSTALRLRHLLELECPGTRLDGPLPPALMDVFATLGPALQAARELQQRKSSATSTLARALLAPAEMRQRETLETAAATLAHRLESVNQAAQSWDGTAATLAAWAREASFLEKWQSQTREALLQLGLD